jgi:fatty acid CoA ligase FadD32
MGFHNPFLKDGLIRFPDHGDLVNHVERWAKISGGKLAYQFLDFSTEREGVERNLNWADFSIRNRAVGARLQQVTEPGDRVAILCPQNLNYMIAFFGTLYSGRIAVPLFDPAEPGHVGRLHAVLDDCQPTAILTTTESAEGVRKFFRSRPAKDRPRVIAVDAVPDEVGATWVHADVTRDTVAYLQYTSGSTRIPTGVQITHLNLATNVVQVVEAIGGDEGDRGVSWLPFFHDMGLITAMVSPMIGHYVTFMTPAAQGGGNRRRHLRRPELRLRPRRGARRTEGRRAADGPVQREGHPQRQRADLRRHRAPVQRGVQPVRVQARGHQAVVRFGRGHAVRVGHPGGPAAEDRPRRP